MLKIYGIFITNLLHTNMAKLFTTCKHDCTLKYMTATRALIRRALVTDLVNYWTLVCHAQWSRFSR